MIHWELDLKIFKDGEGNIGNEKIRKYNSYIEKTQIKNLIRKLA